MTRRKNRAIPKQASEPAHSASAPILAEPTSAAAHQPSEHERDHRASLIPLFLIAVAIAAFHNSFDGAFIFDDARAIPENPAIRTLWPPWESMRAPANSGI